jgi:hypothetical protein
MRTADQTTADVSLLIGNSRYVENDRLWQRVLIWGIPPGRNREVELVLQAGPDGKVGLPVATVRGLSHPLNVVPYSDAAAELHQDPTGELPPIQSRRLPATP